MTDSFLDPEYSLRILAESGKRFIVAHRGSSGTAPENTLISLQKAIDAGASVIEVDVQLTKDNQAICSNGIFSFTNITVHGACIATLIGTVAIKFCSANPCVAAPIMMRLTLLPSA